MTVAVHDVDTILLQSFHVTDQSPEDTSCLQPVISYIISLSHTRRPAMLRADRAALEILAEGSLRAEDWCRGLKVFYRCVPRRAPPIHLFRHFCCRMNRLAIMHSVTQTDGHTDRQTDRRHYDDNSRSYTV